MSVDPDEVQRVQRQLVVAGGVASDAAVGALGVKTVAISPEIDPGLTRMRALSG